MTDLVLEVRQLTISVPVSNGSVNAVRGIDIDVKRGEMLAIVGESGCGKSLTALALVGLLPSRARVSGGSIELLGEQIRELSERQWRDVRGKRISIIFQDPMEALNPVLTIGEQIEEAILAHRSVGRKQATIESLELLAKVRLPDPSACARAYPHQLSGGMRQRVLIAIAIANDPDILVADEPTTALDATVQTEILSLIAELQRERKMSVILITHDLGLVSKWADRAIVMYAGRSVETRPAADLLARAIHPYTIDLLSSRPTRRPAVGERHRLREIPGRVPQPGQIGTGCSFADRCSMAMTICQSVSPEELAWSGGSVWCHAATSAVNGDRLP